MDKWDNRENRWDEENVANMSGPINLAVVAMAVPSRWVTTKRIQTLEKHHRRSFEHIVEELLNLKNEAEQWNYLSHTKRILLEEKWTDTLLKLLKIGNSTVMRSIHYRLNEQMPERMMKQEFNVRGTEKCHRRLIITVLPLFLH